MLIIWNHNNTPVLETVESSMIFYLIIYLIHEICYFNYVYNKYLKYNMKLAAIYQIQHITSLSVMFKYVSEL